MTELGTTQVVAVYAAIVSTIALGWNIVKDYLEKRRSRKERTNIHVGFGITIIKKNVPHFGEMHIFPLCVTNLGRDDVIVTGVELRRKNSKFRPGAYNEPEAALGIYGERMLPRRLEPGDTLTLEQFTFAAFHDCPDEIVVFDADGNEYKVLDQDLKFQFEEIQRSKKRQEATHVSRSVTS